MFRKLLTSAVTATGLLAASLMFTATAAPASEQSGTISSITVRDSDGLIYFLISAPRTSKPACATHDYWMIRNENTDKGKRMYATLLAAHLAGNSVYVWGGNSCTRWPDGEDVEMLRVDP